MGDNQIRIPATDYLKSQIQELNRLYACKADLNTCPSETSESLSAKAVHVYEEATTEMERLLAGVPAANNKTIYLISEGDNVYLTARDISGKTSTTLFEDTEDTLRASCSEGIPFLFPRLHDATYWAHRAGYSEQQIDDRLSAISPLLQTCFDTPASPSHDAAKDEQVNVVVHHEQDGDTSSRNSLGQFGLSFSPLSSYEFNPTRSLVGAGLGIEVLWRSKPEVPWVIGGQIQLMGKLSFDEPTLIGGELKTFEGMIAPLLLEGGYWGKHSAWLLQAGGSFAFQSSEIQPRDVYSENILENGTFRVGIETYLANKRFVLAGGFQQSPWGPGAYLNTGFRIGK